MRIGKKVRTVKSPKREIRKAVRQPIPIPVKIPKKVEAFGAGFVQERLELEYRKFVLGLNWQGDIFHTE